MIWIPLDDYCLESQCQRFRVLRVVLGGEDTFEALKRKTDRDKFQRDRSPEAVEKAEQIWREHYRE